MMFLTVILCVGVIESEAKQDPVVKLDCRLKALIGRTDVTQAKPQALVQKLTGDIFVEVRLHSAGDAALVDLASAGLRTLAKYGGLVTGVIAQSKLLDLAALKVVSTVYPLQRPLLRSVEGQGVASTRADILRETTPGFDGTGIKVGIMSDSFGAVSEATPIIADIDDDGIMEIVGTDSQLGGELPAVVELIQDATPYFDEEGNPYPMENFYSDEGRAMAEIVHEMAPGADIAFHSAFLGVANWANGVLELAEAGCQVLVDDVVYLTMPAYQDGELSQAIEKAVKEHDAVYFSAVGNSSAQCVEMAFNDIDPDNDDGPMAKIPRGNDYHNWHPYGSDDTLDVTIEPKRSIRFTLFWENPYSGTLGAGATTDYDLYVLDKGGNLLVLSDNTQGTEEAPMGDPYEFTGIYNYSETDDLHIQIIVNKHHGPAVNFKLMFWGGGVNISRKVRSHNTPMIIGHNKSDYVMSVAAVNFNEADSDGERQNNPRRIDPTVYSSLGGRTAILFSATGEILAEPEYRFSPDIASIDGANNSFFGSDSDIDDDDLPNFFGTSAAAPHAAAIAAIMRQANPALTSKEICDLMREAATDIFMPGVDFYTGWGFLYADDALRAVPNPIMPLEPTPVATPTVTPTPVIEPTATPVPLEDIISDSANLGVNQVIVTDNVLALTDLSRGTDYDDVEKSDLVIRWNIVFSDVKEYHVYVKVDDQALQYLGRTDDVNATKFVWKANQPKINAIFADGPLFGHEYAFHVFAITESGNPSFYGPFSTIGSVKLEGL